MEISIVCAICSSALQAVAIPGPATLKLEIYPCDECEVEKEAE